MSKQAVSVTLDRDNLLGLRARMRSPRLRAREGHGVVRDPVALVTDTHPLLFHAQGARRLPKRVAAHVAACERGDAVTYVPVVVAWETTLLVRVGKVRLGRSTRLVDGCGASRSARPTTHSGIR